MKIEKMQINGFGKLENKSIEFSPQINLVIGDNESGKSTLASFIKAMLYGINKNKAGEKISEYERLKPWKDIEFSGKMEFEQDGEKYNVFRDFNKNNCKVFDKEANDITKEYIKDKSRGAEIGLGHIGVDEDTFVKTAFIKQGQGNVEVDSQRGLIQKLSNMMSSGEESVSYGRTKTKLEKILQEEIGTERTHNKPKNIVEKSIRDNEALRDVLIKNREKAENIKNELSSIQKKKVEVVDNIEQAGKVYEIKNKYENLIIEKKTAFEEAKKIMAKEKNEDAKKRKRKIKVIEIITAIIAIIVMIILIMYKQYIFSGITCIISILIIYLCIKIRSTERKSNITDIDFTVIQEEMKKKEEKELAALKDMKIKSSFIERQSSELKQLINALENKEKDYTLEEHKFKIEQDLIKDEVNRLNEVEENLEMEYEKREELIRYSNTLKLAVDILDKSYEELKANIIPKISENIKTSIENATNGRYREVIYNDMKGLFTENENGEIVSIDKLSNGTIDQMYFGFRQAMVENFSKDVPIIIDEAFGYYDDERLENVLKMIEKTSEEHQIILFCCTNREKSIFEKNNIQCNIINL